MSAYRYHVLGIGNAIVDIIARTDDHFLEAHGLSKGHMQLIDADQADRLYEAMGPGLEMSGGSAANTCAGLASFGGRSAFIGRVAEDQFGEVFGHDIRSIGVAYATPPANGGRPTARSLILVTPDGERTMNTFLGASTELGQEELDATLIAEAGITYLEGYLFDPPEAKAAFHDAAIMAARAGRKVALSLSDGFCVERHRAAFQSLIASGVDVLFANEDEICTLYEVESFDEACELVRENCTLAALTRGAKGSVIVTRDGITTCTADPVKDVVDTTGAGDLYAAGFLFGLSQGFDVERCGRLGSLAAGEVISHMGARPEASLREIASRRGLLNG